MKNIVTQIKIQCNTIDEKINITGPNRNSNKLLNYTFKREKCCFKPAVAHFQQTINFSIFPA